METVPSFFKGQIVSDVQQFFFFTVLSGDFLFVVCMHV